MTVAVSARPLASAGVEVVGGGALASRKVELSGWGRHPSVTATVFRPEAVSDVARILERSPGSVIARGLGRSYGDAALNESGTVLMQRLDRILAFDPATGIVRCESGVSFADLLRIFVPRGWFPPVTPGTKHVTVGGAVAADVHGKNHHGAGTIGGWVRSMTLCIPSAGEVVCGPEIRPELFSATLGGMGLTGVIIDVDLQLLPVETSWIEQLLVRSSSLHGLMDALEANEPDHAYSVAWIDCQTTARHLGRGIAMFGNHASAATVREAGLDPQPPVRVRPRLTVPLSTPSWTLNRVTTRLANSVYYRAKGRQGRSIEFFDGFFYPLDGVGSWNRLYGSRGLAQYQCVFPPVTSREGVEKVLRACAAEGQGSPLAVLKRFGPGRGLLSFPIAGYTLAIDMPVRRDLPRLLGRLDDIVVELGGRVYLAKDAFLRPGHFRAMYPEWERWARIRGQADPERRLASHLSARLGVD